MHVWLVCCLMPHCGMQVIAEVSMEQDDDADYDRKLSQLKREEELINEEAKEAAAFLQTDIPVIRPGQVHVTTSVTMYWPKCCRRCLILS